MRTMLLHRFPLRQPPLINLSKKIFKTVLLTIFTFSVALQLSAQQLGPEARKQIQYLMNEKASRTTAQKKIDSHILYAFKLQNDQSFSKALPDFKSDVKADRNGKIKVDIEANVSPQLINDLRSAGVDIIFSSVKFKNIVANIPLSKVEQVAENTNILHINAWLAPLNNSGFEKETNNNKNTNKVEPGFETRAANVRKKFSDFLNKEDNFYFAGSTASEADATHKAAVARNVFGVDGSGIKIGVLSDGVDGYTNSQASGDLPNITILAGQAGSGSEGRAMLELIHDIAPGADLYFATAFTSQASFAQNILDLRAAGCDIIVDDVTYYAEGVFQDDNVAQSVNFVTADGALYFTSAGNSGNKNDGTAGVWEGDFVDGGSVSLFPGGTVNDFGSGVLYDAVTGTTGLTTLKWSDPLGLSGNDYDLFATNSTGTTVYSGSNNIQDGNDNPYEYLPYNFPAGYRIYIFKKTGAAVRALHLNTNRGRLNITTPGVMYGHNSCASAYTVAATPAANPFYAGYPQGPYPNPFNTSNAVEGFSSDGPRRIFFNPDGTEITPGNILFGTNGGSLLQKPDITAADGVSTATPGFNPFYGTSAAAPNAAAIAALVKSKFPLLTPAEIRTALLSSAIDIEAPGVDRDAGGGIIMAYEALTAAGATAVSIQATTPVTITAENAAPPNNAVDPGETVTVSLPLINVGNINTTDLIATLQATASVTNPGDPQSYGVVEGNGPAVARSFTFKAAGNCGDNITLTLALHDGVDDLGTITYTIQLGTDAPAGPPVTFSNTSAITIPSSGTGTPYPSTIDVSGLTGKISKITVGLKQFNHTWPGDVDVLLVSPTGKKMIIMSDVNETTTDAINLDIVLDDAAVNSLPSGSIFTSGTYKPTNYGANDPFVAPAPSGPYENPGTAGSATLNGVFGGDVPNGTWSLYVVDDASGDAGSFNGGWEISIATSAPVCSVVPPGPSSSVLSLSGASDICNGSSTDLSVAITDGTAPFKIVYTDGTNEFTVNNYNSGENISVSPTTSVTYSLVSVTDANDMEGSNNSGTAVVNVTDPTTWYADNDHDAYGDPNNSIQACEAPDGYVSNSDDCDDNNNAVNPAAVEICGDGIDNNCNGQIDEGCTVSNLRLVIIDKEKSEGNRNQSLIKLTVKLNKRPTSTVTVDYHTENITAIAGSDYIATSGTLTFAPGVKKQTINVIVNGDRTPEPDETFRVLLSNPSGADIADGEGIATILNDDDATLASEPVITQAAQSNLDKTIKISPNPAQSRAYITLSGYSGIVTIQLQSLDGKVLKQEKLQPGTLKVVQQPIDLAGLPNGVYLVTVTDEKGKRKTEKLIIQR